MASSEADIEAYFRGEVESHIRHNRARLIKVLNVTSSLLEDLEARGVIQTDVKQDVQSYVNQGQQIEASIKLLGIIPVKISRRHFRHFCDALRETGQNNIVEDYLKPTSTPENEEFIKK